MQPRALDLLRRHGWNVYSFEILEPGLRYWFSDLPAVVAYVDRGGYRVAVGPPVCAPEHAERAAAEFAREAGGRAAFFGASDAFLEHLDPRRWDWIQVGLQPAWDPRGWKRVLEQSPDLRRRLRRATRAGVTVREVPWRDLAEGTGLRRSVDDLVERWEQAHAMPPMRFMVTLDLFSHAPERRYFLAESADGLQGLLVGVPIYARGGWLLDDLLVLRTGAPGASEALVDLAMATFGREGAGYVSLGMVALAGLGEGRRPPRAHPILDRLFNFCLRSMSWLYSFQGIHAFRSKFRPDRWEPVYLVGSRRVHLLTLRAVLMAFGGGWIVGFAARVAGRRWGASIGRALPVMAAGMVAWTGVLLAHAHLFGGPSALGWAAFDWLQAWGLWRIPRAADRRRAVDLSLRAALADAAVTAATWLLWPPSPASGWEAALLTAALAGPLALAFALSLHREVVLQ